MTPFEQSSLRCYNDIASFSHDEAGRLATEPLTIDGVTYTIQRSYDTAGRSVQLTYPDGSAGWLGGRVAGCLGSNEVSPQLRAAAQF